MARTLCALAWLPSSVAFAETAAPAHLEPPQLLETVEAEYPEQARRQGLTGVVTLQLVVSPNGAVDDARVVRTAGSAFDASALAAARRLRFKPARRDGQPVAVQLNYEVAFVRAASAPATFESTIRALQSTAPREDTVADASVITSDRTPRAGESVAQLISELPGVTVTHTGGIGSLSMISLRGSTWNQVNVYVDGVQLNSGVTGAVDLSTLPIGDIDRIEVYRGSSPIAFGSSALGGVISITTRAPTATGATAEVGVGSFDTAEAGATASWVGTGARVYVGAHYLNSAGNFFFTSDNGVPFDTAQDHTVERQNNAVSQADGVARVIVPLAHERELTVSFLGFSCDQGLPGYGSVRQITDTSLDTLRFTGSVSYDSPTDLGPGSRLRAQLYTIYGDQKFKDPLGEISIQPESTNDQSWTTGGTLRLVRPMTDWLTLSGVADLRYEELEPYDSDETPPRGATATRVFAGLGAEVDAFWAAARLHILPSIRGEAIHDARSGIGFGGQEVQVTTPVTDAAPTGRLALLEQVTGAVSLRANAGRYVRFPTTYELYGNSGYILGNPALAPESGWNGDIGAQARFGTSKLGATLDATLFGSYVTDLIQFQQDAYGRASALNIGKARVLGAEATFEGRYTTYARLLLNGTFTDARDVSDTSIGQLMPLLPNLPRFHVYVRPEGRLPVAHDLVLGAYVDGDFTDGNYLDPANLVALPPRVFIGTGIFAEALQGGLRVIASGQNLSDVRAFDYAGFPLPSRSFFITARYTFTPENHP